MSPWADFCTNLSPHTPHPYGRTPECVLRCSESVRFCATKGLSSGWSLSWFAMSYLLQGREGRRSRPSSGGSTFACADLQWALRKVLDENWPPQSSHGKRPTATGKRMALGSAAKDCRHRHHQFFIKSPNGHIARAISLAR
ncbi:unnamed protein product [Ixodes pacificus]